MNAYLVHQARQMERAKTFAEMRRIEERVSRMAQAKPEVRRRAVWPFGALASRRRRAVVRMTPLSRREVPVEAGGHPQPPRKGPLRFPDGQGLAEMPREEPRPH